MMFLVLIQLTSFFISSKCYQYNTRLFRRFLGEEISNIRNIGLSCAIKCMKIKECHTALVKNEKCITLNDCKSYAFNQNNDHAFLFEKIVTDKIIEFKEKKNLNFSSKRANIIKVLQNGDLVVGTNSSVEIFNGTHFGTKLMNLSNLLTLEILKNSDIATGSFDYKISIWNSTNWNLKMVLIGHNNYVRALTVLENGDLASGSYDKTIKIWDVENGTVKMTLQGHENWILYLVVLKNGNLASASADNKTIIWNLTNGTAKWSLISHSNQVTTLTVLQNGDLASGSNDKTIKIWNINNGKEIVTLKGHQNSIRSLAILKNGDLVSGSYKEIRVWNVNNWCLKLTLNADTNWIFSLVVLENGDLITGLDNAIKIWQ